MVIDNKMKLELGKRVREIQRDWYGKWGISLHGCYVVAQVDENQRSSEVFDLWSEDTKQDAFFTQSTLESAFPGWKGSFLDTLYTSFLVCVCFKFIILQFIVNTKPALVHMYVCLYTDGQ